MFRDKKVSSAAPRVVQMRYWSYRMIAVSFLVLWPCVVSAQTAEVKLAALEKLPAEERQQKLYDQAKAEGEAVIYANMDISAMKPLTDGFMQRYPGTKATSVHFSGAAIITRLESEARAGKPLSDVVLSGQLGVLALIDKKIALRYRSPEREFFRAGLKDQDGLVDRLHDQCHGQRIQYAASQKRRSAAQRE